MFGFDSPILRQGDVLKVLLANIVMPLSSNLRISRGLCFATWAKDV